MELSAFHHSCDNFFKNISTNILNISFSDQIGGRLWRYFDNLKKNVKSEKIDQTPWGLSTRYQQMSDEKLGGKEIGDIFYSNLGFQQHEYLW